MPNISAVTEDTRSCQERKEVLPWIYAFLPIKLRYEVTGLWNKSYLKSNKFIHSRNRNAVSPMQLLLNVRHEKGAISLQSCDKDANRNVEDNLSGFNQVIKQIFSTFGKAFILVECFFLIGSSRVCHILKDLCLLFMTVGAFRLSCVSQFLNLVCLYQNYYRVLVTMLVFSISRGKGNN